jgi:double-stranded uracil-DNA glycosylase
MSLATSFPPIASPDARVLVLGSMPSIASLAKVEYYAHPRNAFWAIMGRLFGAAPEWPYRRRQQLLRAHQVAVWDVLRECYREGSLDTSIDAASEVPNDFAVFFAKHPHIGTVFFNGLKAETAYRRHVLPLVDEDKRQFRYVRLPSTSPAHAGRSFDEKLAAWSQIRDALNGWRRSN